MPRRLLLCILALAGMASASTADQAGGPPRTEIPGTGVAVEAGAPTIDHATGLPEPRLVEALAAWLAVEIELPAMREPPGFALVSPAKLISLRLGGASADPAPPVANAQISPGDVVAVYDRHARTIYLPDGWDGSTPAELSVVVHELVQHLQNEAGQKAACPEVLEGAAFAAQEQWLALFGTDLYREFGLDPFTLLVRTNCLY
jgi:hypothetical protein